MARTQGACPRRVWFWRWRRNPLRRRSDVVEAWLLLATLVCGLVLACAGALAAAGAVDASLAERRAHSHAVGAVLTEDAARALPAPAPEEGDTRVWTKVRWTAPDGTARTGMARADADAKAGTEVTVWTDREGRLVSEPPGGAEARFQTVMAGATVGVTAGGLALIAGWVLRTRLLRRRTAEWESAWRLVEPAWRKRMLG
ncbi:hypothetical protein [Streptomyces sp. NPDC029526]|uniref:Rv1733c family protein n=1 Tax=Streptomyces sp. NPDC029526 TaxID=3155728 RepID=UPI0033CF4556